MSEDNDTGITGHRDASDLKEMLHVGLKQIPGLRKVLTAIHADEVCLTGEYWSGKYVDPIDERTQGNAGFG
tara:strand:+ start:12403 stop:12615 length:213 start_codon:yes stop_codon:yes gene_type:complete